MHRQAVAPSLTIRAERGTSAETACQDERVTPPRATLGRVVDALGATLLETLAGTITAREVTSVLIHDPLDLSPLTPGTLVLAVGVSDGDAIAELLGQPEVAAVIVRLPVSVDERLRQVAEDAGTVLFGLARGATWAQVAALLRSLLAVDDVGGSEGGGESPDLFAVANAVAALIAAPVTIEDRSSRVVAFSSDQQHADSGRVATILGRQVPEHFRVMLEERGVFRALYAGDEPVHIDPLPGNELARTAVRVRAGDEILGSIWAAVDGPLSAERTRALVESTKLVALHMLRERAGADVERRMRSDLVATLLEGGTGAVEAASRLGIGSTSLCVLALAARREDLDAAAAEADFQRVAAAFAMHLSAVHPKSAVAPVGGVLYGLLPVADGSADRAEAVAGEFCDRLGARADVVIGIGRVVQDRTALPRSRDDADRALRVLRDVPGARRVAQAADVHVDSLLLVLGDMVERDDDDLSGPLARLVAYDAEHGTDLVDTLSTWLDTFGDVNTAAKTVHVHPNTFRYRLRRLAEIGELDLGDPDARFAAMLQLRLRRRTTR